MKTNYDDLIGAVFGRLTVKGTEPHVTKSGKNERLLVCDCECGNVKSIRYDDIKRKRTLSCGCLKNPSGLLKDNPDVMKYYDYEKNELEGVDLNKIAAKSNKKLWFKCSVCGEGFCSQPNYQTSAKCKHMCVYCAGLKVKSGHNDLLSQYPDVAAEWDYEANELTPDKVHKISHSHAYWICKDCHHRWRATVDSRTGVDKTGCPKCHKYSRTSFPEQAIYFYVNQVFPDAINGDRTILNGAELDIYIPSIKAAIEYDGRRWHKDKDSIEKDKKKNNLCKENGITLYRIREPSLDYLDDCVVVQRDDYYSSQSLNNAISKLFTCLHIDNITVDVEKDRTQILKQYSSNQCKDSLAARYPEIAEQWHPTKNGEITPDMINYSNPNLFWWYYPYDVPEDYPIEHLRGKHFDFEWQAKPSNRIHEQGCPFLVGHGIIWVGFNDLETTHPDIAKTWDYSKNKNLTPKDVTFFSKREVFWKCENGHTWKTTVSGRRSSCPYCSGRRAWQGENDLATLRPDLAAQWDYEENGGLLPSDFTCGSHKKVGWICENGHKWNAVIRDRTKRPTCSCPKCKSTIGTKKVA